MLDSDFNVFLIEINTNPGLEISSPWIQIVVPRMLDDALRLTVDKVFEPIYDFNKNYKGNYTEEQKKLLNDSKINFDFNAVDFDMNKNTSSILSSSMKLNTLSQKETNKNSIFNINLDLDEADKKIIKTNIKEKDKDKSKEIQNKQENEVNKDNNSNKNKIIKSENESLKKKENNEDKLIKNNIKDKDKDKDKKGTIKPKKDEKSKKYISPFPVPGYSLDENLWEFVCDLNTKDPLEINNEKETINNKDREIFTGIRHLLKKKEKRNKGEKGVPKKNNKGKKIKNKKSNK